MKGAQSISTRRAYGVQRVCRVWARARSSVYARRQAPRDCARGHRRGPVGAAPDEVLVGHIRRVLEASPFHGEGYGSRGFGPRRSGCADSCVRTTSRPRTAWARRMARRCTTARQLLAGNERFVERNGTLHGRSATQRDTARHVHAGTADLPWTAFSCP